ncbi:MAG: hypothetical protein C0591_14015 [Marinilabiliales bacterium]|nr:MAG: hypothetical protein C0591_14015 [Marinilabiliales bacterium]
MKRFYALLTVMMFVFSVNAQYIYNDFDENQNETFLGDPNIPTVIANPFVGGINTSAGVAEWVRAATNQWTHVYTIVDGTIDFSTGTTFQLKVYSPIACEVLFKLESSANPSVSTEVMGNVTTPNEWQQLSYDFTGAASGTYDKIVIFFDFATMVENTFYFDDIIGPDFEQGAVGDPVTLPVTFEDENVNYGLTDFGGNSSEIVVDPTDSENHVAKTIKTEGAETWAGTTVGGTVGFPNPIPFAEGATTMTVNVWSPTAGTPIRLKVEASNDETVTCETEALTTVAMEWEELTFDFSNEAPGTAELNFASSYNKASMFFNFDSNGTGETYYWDNMAFEGGSEPKPYLAQDVQENFEDDGYSTIPTWWFQDAPDLTALPIVEDPADPENHIADYVRSGTFEWTNAQFVLDWRMNLTERNQFDLMVKLPSSNDYSGDLTPTVAMKLQNSLLGGNAWTTQTEVKLTVDEFDTWVTLTFDFSEAADREDYDQVVIQIGGEGHLVPGLFYFDNLVLLNPSGVINQTAVRTNVYPNPASDVLYLENAANLNDVSIYSVVGQLIYQSEKVNSSINISDFPAGIYTLHANGNDGKQYFAKFIVK